MEVVLSFIQWSRNKQRAELLFNNVSLLLLLCWFIHYYFSISFSVLLVGKSRLRSFYFFSLYMLLPRFMSTNGSPSAREKKVLATKSEITTRVYFSFDKNSQHNLNSNVDSFLSTTWTTSHAHFNCYEYAITFALSHIGRVLSWEYTPTQQTYIQSFTMNFPIIIALIMEQ